jgi:hypothetical protein
MKIKYKISQNKDLGIYKVNNIKINDVVKLKNNDEMRIVGFREEDDNIIVMGYFSSDDCGGDEKFENIVKVI